MLITIQERTLEEHNRLVEGILKRDKKRRKRIEAAGIDYKCPEMVRDTVSLLHVLISCAAKSTYLLHVPNWSRNYLFFYLWLIWQLFE